MTYDLSFLLIQVNHKNNVWVVKLEFRIHISNNLGVEHEQL